jgi:hypothetical protein
MLVIQLRETESPKKSQQGKLENTLLLQCAFNLSFNRNSCKDN